MRRVGLSSGPGCTASGVRDALVRIGGKQVRYVAVVSGLAPRRSETTGCGSGLVHRIWNVEKIFATINQMEADGVIGRYAIGGAVGAIFWLEPILTKDVDVFVSLPTAPGGLLLTLGPIYDYLLALGFVPEGQFIVIEGWAVEFVPPGTPLVEEALDQAVIRDVNGVPTRVFTAEHLAAICLQVGRPRDHDRVIRFVEAGVLDAADFNAILTRHDLTSRWQQFQETHLEA